MAGSDGGTQDETPQQATPQQLAGYELLGRLGKGGMGTVLRARQVSMDRLVALKILPKRLAQNADFVARFIREARSAARLSHPHIVQAYDVGKSEGYYYFAMELIEGEGLEAILAREGPLEQNRALGYLKQVCSALAHAHGAGIVHRDIKPSNLMIDRTGNVRVTDFGLARRAEDDIVVTADGATLGTPAYVSPEMARGGEADARSDLYSLGATFFHLLAGRPPFEGKSFSEVLIKQATEPPPHLAELAPHVDRRLCRILDRLLAKNPDERAASAKALRDDLDALGELKEHVEPARPAAATQRPKHAGTARRRHQPRKAKPKAALVVAGIAALVVAGVVVLVLSRQGSPTGGPETKPPAQIAFDEAEQYRAAQPTDFDGAITRYRLVQTRFPGTEWATRAKAEATELEGAKQRRAAEARAKKAFEREVTALRTECRRLAGLGRFGAALEQIAAFRKKHPAGGGATEASTLSLEVLGKAQSRYAELAREAEAALAAKDYAKARDALRPALAFGIASYADRARKKLAEIDDRETKTEHWAKWERIKTTSDRLAQAGKWDEAIQALDAAKGLPLANVAELIAAQARAIQATRQKAVDAVVAAYLKQSDEVWTLFGTREYAKARDLIARLRSDATYRVARDRIADDEEAARLLVLFWANVEGGMAALVGKQSAIRGAVGTVKQVEGGVVTLVVGGAATEYSIYDITAEQAIGLAKLGDEPKDKLLLAAFLIAEGSDLAKARPALAAAGKGPAVAALRRHLDRAAETVAITPGQPDKAGELRSLFDGKTLNGWSVIPGVDPRWVGVGKGVIGFYEHGCAGIVRDGAFPTDDYEVAVEIQRVKGSDRFCEIVFPVGDAYCAFLIGDGRLGLDVVDGTGWQNNRTTLHRAFAYGRWHTVRVRVTAESIGVWVDREQVIKLPRAAVRFTLWHGFEIYPPFGISSRGARAAVRRILVRRLATDKPLVVGVGVTGRDGWQKTGPRLTAGRRYELAATGTWSAIGRHRCGPNGGGVTTDAEFALPGAQGAALIGRLGKDGKPFLVGSRLVLAPDRSAELYLAMNDSRYGDNSGQLRVTIRELLPETVVETKVSVPARASWVDSRRDLVAGRRYELTASGAWINARGSKVGPEGRATETATADYPLPGAPAYCLIGRIGQAGKPFAIGRHLIFASEQSGRLYMQINDPRLRNNSWDVRVTIREVPPEAGEWQSLFDGTSLREWTPRGGEWSVADGAIVGRVGTKDGLLEYTGASFGDFVLEAEVLSTGKLPGPRLGVVFHKESGRFLSFALNDQFGAAGVVAGGVWSGKMKGVELRWQPGLEVTRDSSKGYEGVSVQIESGHWYRLSVRGEGKRFQCAIDGKLLVEGTLSAPASGAVGLCIHRADARFRNVRLRRLGADDEPRGGAKEKGEWRVLFDGKSKEGWKPVPKEGSFARPGDVSLEDGAIVMGPGNPHTGVLWTGPLPKGSYELTYEAMKLAGPYQFGYVAFPVGDGMCALDMGGGARHNIVGLSGVDGKPFTGNLTTRRIGLRHNQWYRVRVRVSGEKIEVWLDDSQIVDLPRAGHTFSAALPGGARSFAFFGYKNTCAVRDIRARALSR